MKLQVALIYSTTGGEEIIVARTSDEEVIKAAKFAVVDEAKKEAEMWKKLDEGCYELALANLKRLALLFVKCDQDVKDKAVTGAA
jgi:hypothetical protein